MKERSFPTHSARRRAVISLAATPVLAAMPRAFAQDAYPSRPVKIIVTLAPGGGVDLFGRLLGTQLTNQMGQTFFVENKAGAGTNIGASFVAKAAPDGYTLLLSSSTTYALNASLYKNLNYDPAKDFAPIALGGRFALVLVANSQVPVTTVKDVIALAKSKSLDYASPGNGSPHQLAMELFKIRTGIEAAHIPFKGAGPAVQEVIAGRIPFMFLDYATAAPFLKSGHLKVIATAGDQRLPMLPAVPTIAESGFAGFETSAWLGLAAPAGTPDPIVRRLNAEVSKMLANPDFRRKLIDLGITPFESTPESFTAFARSETVKWSEVIRRANITVD
jgi:tripartite-type tricarboxylate transporter receptor subunit TctC